jgi:hypothetical protein
VPPSVMLLGYLLLLRAAAKADAERREMARYRTKRADAEAARVPVRRSAAAAGGAAAGGAAGVVSAGSARGAAGAKVITIPAAAEAAGEEIYDQYADAKLRAVGD